MTTIERIRQKCIEANPEIRGREYVYTGARGGKAISTVNSPIRLADVLLALLATKKWVEVRLASTDFEIGYDDHADENSYTKWVSWSLRNDDLEQQSEECVEFIGRVLNV